MVFGSGCWWSWARPFFYIDSRAHFFKDSLLYQTARNTFHAPGKAFKEACGSSNLDLAAWQKLGQDAGSSATDGLADKDIVEKAKAKLA